MTARSIVQTNTNELIQLANAIIIECTAPNCNTDPTTQTRIFQDLSMLSQQQATSVLNGFGISSSTVVAENIFGGYIDLSAAVGSTYIYQCGSKTSGSIECVNAGASVQQAQDRLVDLLDEPIQTESNYLVATSVLGAFILLTIMMFTIFMILGLVESEIFAMDTSSERIIPSTKEIQPINEIQPTNEIQPLVATPSHQF